MTNVNTAMTFEEQWKKHVKQRNAEIFDKKSDIHKPNNKDPFHKTMFIINRVVELMEEEQKKQVPFRKEFSVKGMTKFQEYINKIEKIDKLLFPRGGNFFSSIIFEEYNIEHGLQGLDVIINHFVKWQNSEKNCL